MPKQQTIFLLICCSIILTIGFMGGYLHTKRPINIVTIPDTVIPFTPLGEHTLTWYCPTGNRTASMTEPKEGRTVAVDTTMGINFGDTVYIEGYGAFVAEDTGSAIKGRRVDIYIEDCRQAMYNGVKKSQVYLIE